MAYPIRDVSLPASLRGQSNGKLDPGILKRTAGQAGGPDVELVEPAARAWRALTDAAKRAGHVLKISGAASAYRTYAMQELIFRQRYTTIPNGTRGRYWSGPPSGMWFKKPGVAAAAVPGTSNHGWGLACDTGEERDGDTGTESIDAGTVAWLVANEERYGFSHELQSEPWHIRYFTGDQIPAAVTAYELGLRPDPIPEPLPTTEAPMLYETPSGSVCFLTEGKMLLVIDAKDADGITKDERAQLLNIQASLPEDSRRPVPCSSEFWKRLVSVFPVVR